MVTTENTINITLLIKDCIEKVASKGKTVCAVCSDNFSSNISSCKIENLNYPIYRQYCNCHCAALALSNYFDQKLHEITLNINLSLRLLHPFKPPFFSHVKWKSLSDCISFIVDNFDKLTSIIDNQKHCDSDAYLKLKNTDWKSIRNVVSIVTSLISCIESDQMKIEFVFGEFTKTVQLLKKENTDISKELLTELINVYSDNETLIVPLAAFLLTIDGAIFWQRYSIEKQSFYKEYGWKGISKLCDDSQIILNENIKIIFFKHLSTSYNQYLDPYYLWYSQRNELSEIA